MNLKPAFYTVATLMIAAAVLARPHQQRAPAPAPAEAPPQPVVAADSPVAAGKYIVRISGCNDCHTPNFMVMGEQVPETQWLTGNPIGFKGPWGTTYPANLRRFVQPFTAEQFVEAVRKRSSRPPMPWPQLHAMSDADLRAVYAYVKSLPVAGTAAAPDFVPPDREPKTPFILMVPQIPASESAQASRTADARGR